jgi:hypothetical protein
MMKNVEQIKQALREISSCYQDSRERGNCKVPEDALKRWHQMLDETLLEVGAVIDTPLLARLRNEVLMSKMTHNFTLTRDEVIELMGGKFYVLVKWANARESTSETQKRTIVRCSGAATLPITERVRVPVRCCGRSLICWTRSILEETRKSRMRCSLFSLSSRSRPMCARFWRPRFMDKITPENLHEIVVGYVELNLEEMCYDLHKWATTSTISEKSKVRKLARRISNDMGSAFMYEHRALQLVKEYVTTAAVLRLAREIAEGYTKAKNDDPKTDTTV